MGLTAMQKEPQLQENSKFVDVHSINANEPN